MLRVRCLAEAWVASLGDYPIDLQWSPDGGTLAVASVSGPVLLLDPATGRVRRELAGHAGGTASVAWRPDGAVLATAGQDGHARLWDAASGAALAALEGGAAWVEHLAWHPRGRALATAAGRVQRRFGPDGALLGEARPAPSTISALAWRPDGRVLAVGRYGGVELVPEDGGAAETLAWKGSILSLAWRPDGGALAGGGQDCSVQFWFFARRERLEMSGYAAKVTELAWGGDLLATSGDATVTVWDCAGPGPSGQTPIQFSHHAGLVSALAFQPVGGLLASGAADGVLCLWDVRAPERPVATLKLGGAAARLAWSPDGVRLAVGAANGCLFVRAVCL
jgi:WD40 repeat protein